MGQKGCSAFTDTVVKQIASSVASNVAIDGAIVPLLSPRMYVAGSTNFGIGVIGGSCSLFDESVLNLSKFLARAGFEYY